MEEDSDVSDNEAREDAYEDMKSVYRTAMMNSFANKLLWFEAMKRDPVYKSVRKTINRLIDTEGYEQGEALKYGILKRQFLFDKVLDIYNIPNVSEDDINHQPESPE
ncbi:hypothetical protein ACF0H5_016058 [Mactra antiquata]